MFVQVEILEVKDAEEGVYSTAVSYTEGLSIQQVCTILAASLIALMPEEGGQL